MSERTVEIREVVVGDDGLLTLYLQDAGGETRKVKLSLQAQGLVLQALLGSTLDPLSHLSRRFEPIGISRFRLDDGVGVSFLLSRQLGVHFLLDRLLAETLKDFIATFDDASTWHAPKLN